MAIGRQGRYDYAVARNGRTVRETEQRVEVGVVVVVLLASG
jgi:tRNA U55 pseudouridine synthase TruB